MDVLYSRCCGLDVHKRTVVACVIITGSDGQPHKELRTFGTTTDEVLRMSDWLKANECTHVAMESTGVYWKPIYNLLEGQFELLVVNAQHMKAIPGRKTDMRDAEWIAELLRHGLLKASFVPSASQRELRDLTRYRSSLVQERARIVNRLQKVLEDTNVKLASVASDITGVSARAMLQAMLAGENDTQVLAGLARGRLREKRAELEKALLGRMKDHHRFMIAELLGHIDYLDEAVDRVSAEIQERVRPFERQIALLDSIPGVNRRTAEVLIAEIGTDMSRFPSAQHLASWAGMCPGNNQSGGKRRHGKTRKGSRWLHLTLVEAAHGAARSKNTYLSAQYTQLARRRSRKKAEVAVGHSILIIAYYLLLRDEPYRDLGGNYFDERKRDRVQRRLVSRLERLGYQVTLTPATLAA